MKKNIIVAVLLVCICMVSGCSVVKDGCELEPTYGNATSIKIEETGGIDGRNLVWQMYEKDGKYYFSADNLKFDKHILQEITEDEYKSIMHISYDRYFEKYKRDNSVVIMDDIYHHSTIEFKNHVTYEGDDYYMSEIINRMLAIASKYDTCDFTEFYY